MKIDFAKLLEISARTAFAVACACLMLLFIPAAWLPFDITGFREEYGIWLLVTLVLAISIMLSYLLKWLCTLAKEKYKKYKVWSGYKTIIECLSDNEKAFLKSKYDEGETTLMLNLTSPMHKHLQTLQILSLNVGTNLGGPTRMPGFIQPWVFDMMRKKPELFETKTQENDNG